MLKYITEVSTIYCKNQIFARVKVYKYTSIQSYTKDYNNSQDTEDFILRRDNDPCIFIARPLCFITANELN